MVAHEIGHALGFWHTHARYDRNDFITVLRKNVKHKRRKNFAKLSRETNNNYNLTYDYGSVMHYGARTFTKNATDVAIVPKDVNYMETLGSKFIAFYDLLMMNTYYNCTDACRYEETDCHNGGFPHPRNCSKCICPSGFCSNTFVNTTLTSHSSLVPVITYSLNKIVEQANEESHYESVAGGVDLEDYDYSDEDDKEEKFDELEYGEYELDDAVKLAYRYV
ncbi:astacin [Teladorsagia circumcincta]|uniref:Metalloendopeptidase n=1 Tax=Teladorsagia circumcincta TaxID=45464 RepID=A0A2G9UCT5_TELCI|nr:astacin [Teladorsagia circumcincta]